MRIRPGGGPTFIPGELEIRLNLTENYKLQRRRIARLERLQGCKLARLKGFKGFMQPFKLEGLEGWLLQA